MLLLACSLLALALLGCDDFDDSATASDEPAAEQTAQEQKDDRAQKAANDAIDNVGGMNVDYGN